MADKPSADDMIMSFEENDRSKEVEVDSDELSGQSFSDGDNAGPREGSDGDDRKRKKRRRGRHKGGKHHRKWRPYTKLSWSERKVADARETQRANQKREDAFASGHPVAPYNTTQFLIDDHIQSEASPDLNHEPSPQPAARPVPAPPPPVPQVESTKQEDPTAVFLQNEDSSYSMGPSSVPALGEEEEEQFLAKEFSTTYESLHLERLQSMSKEELVKENLELEKKVERMERMLSLHGKDSGVKDADKESSDANSLGSSNEEFMDLNNVKQEDATIS
ncbi:hypothetical protein BaRGS_00011145 [Batillaria attramentaria]|uniref:Uncharacterized protein n=1 Tax=Batillaria attramentaria TaxID=370345 RepID=A0ABD0LDP0_9CAEN|nr:hypothetical protein BaRGS_011829 [Batillaria attramentaria]